MSGFIPERILDEIRFRNDIVEVIGSYISLKRMGSTYKACCPFHKEKTPSFNVNPNMQIFKCFGCGEGGDVITFLMKHQGMDFVTAARALAERAGIEIEVEADSSEGAQRKTLYAIHHGITQFYRRCLEQYPAAQAARDYVEERGLGGETAEAFQIGYAPAGWGNALKWAEKHGYTPDQLEQAGLVLRSEKADRRGVFYDRFRDRLMFPIHDSQGRVIAFSARILIKDPKQPKYVNSPETPIFSKGRVLYGLDKARRHIVNNTTREALICEGQIDVVRCHQCGFPTAVAAQGTAFTEDHVQLLKNYADSVVLVFDADAAGQAAAVKTAHLFMKAGLVVRVAVLPTGEDPDSFLRAKGEEAFRERLDQAVSLVAYQIGVLGAKESDVRGIAATARIANAVLETLCCSPHAVLRERMLQEAAALLGLPQHALETDLAVMEAAQKAQADRYSRRGGHAAAAGTGRETGGAPAETASPVSEADAFHESDDHDTEPPADVLDMLRQEIPTGHLSGMPGSGAPGAPNGTVRPPVRELAIPDEERALCEHLVQGSSDPHLAKLVEENLPLRLLAHPLCRRLAEAALAASREGCGLDVYIERAGLGSDVALRLFWTALKEQPVRIKGGDYTRRDAVQDLILGFWRRYLLLEKKRLELPAAEKKAAAAARRAQLAVDINSLKRWETGQVVILIEYAMLAEQPEPGA